MQEPPWRKDPQFAKNLALGALCDNRAVPRRAVLPLLLVVPAVLLAAGCGGSKKYSLGPTRACLKKQSGLQLRQKVDFVASTALGGAVSVVMPKNEVTISFGLDQAEAERIAAAYRRFRGKNIGIEDVLRPKKNAVLLWEAHPSERDESTIDDCLR
jgi:hypothetical protein